MKIIQYLPYSYHIHTGGLEKIAQTISNGLNKTDAIQCKNVSSDIRRGGGEDLKYYEDTIFLPSFDLVYNFPFPKFWSKSFWQHFTIIKQYQPDIIITHTRFFVQSFIGGIIAKRIGCKRVHIEHGSGFVKGYSWYIKFFAWLFDYTVGLWIFRQCDKIVTISNMHKKFISNFTKKEPVVIYNPVDFVSQKKIINETVHIGFIGRFVPLKGVDLLIKALKLLEDKNRKCTLVGTGSEDKYLEQLTNDLGLSNRIKFVGADDREKWLHKFDIFVNPSYQEGLPTTVVEALISGVIVVATDVGGTREITNKPDLILVKPGLVSDLYDGIIKAFNSFDYSGDSLEIVKEKFSLDESIRKYIHVIKNCYDQKMNVL